MFVCPMILVRGSIEVDEIANTDPFKGDESLVKASIKLVFESSTLTAPMCKKRCNACSRVAALVGVGPIDTSCTFHDPTMTYQTDRI